MVDQATEARPEVGKQQSEQHATRAFYEQVLSERAGTDSTAQLAPQRGNGDKLNGLDRALDGLTKIPNGVHTPESIRQTVDALNKITFGMFGGVELPPELDKLESLTVKGTHYDVRLKQPESIPINREIPGSFGFASIDSIQVDKEASFDLKKNEDGSYSMTNIEGVSIRTTVAGQEVDIKVKELNVRRNNDGELVITPTLENPLGWGADLVGMPENYRPQLVVGKHGSVRIDNKTELASKTVTGPVLTAVNPLLIIVNPILNDWM